MIESTCKDRKLTAREFQVLELLVTGKSNSKIGQILKISRVTAKAHVGNILKKMNVEDRIQAAVKAVRTNLV